MSRIALVVGVLLFAVGCQKKAEVIKPLGKFDESDLHGKMTAAIEGDAYSEFLDLREIFVNSAEFGPFVPEAGNGEPQKYAAYLFYVPGNTDPAKATVSYDISVFPNSEETFGPDGLDPVLLLYKLGGDRIAKRDENGGWDGEIIDDIVLEEEGIYMAVVAEFDLDPGEFWINVSSCDDCIAFCGDGATDEGEFCDDAGESETCDIDCTDAYCGDFSTNATRGEFCDGGAVDTFFCDSDCTQASCGDSHTNGQLEVPEACDDGGDSETCDSDCTLPSCGDSHFNSAAEICDTNGNTETCDSDCTAPACLDGILNTSAGEECEDGDDSNPEDGCHNCELSGGGGGEVTYVIPLEGLVNQNSVCSNPANRHNGSNDQPFGITWTDSAPFTPQSMTVELFNGVSCDAIGPGGASGGSWNRLTTLNGFSTGGFDLTTPATCSCGPTPVANTLNVPTTNYNSGGVNTFLVVAGTSIEGLSSNPAWEGGFARVTVYESAP